ncbi:hypothetical protein J3Q64DRAFT_1837704 [Phycomyces blakesleeanus]|uniref:Uncharacterized protein n=1 Tax=Phycomyces blakesleeanus TaxID=4837 RepID=A0ABR3ATU0_PHYBL
MPCARGLKEILQRASYFFAGYSWSEWNQKNTHHVTLLINGEFREELIALLGKVKVVPLGNFDPTAADVIADPKLKEETIEVRAKKTQDLFDARLIKASLRMATYLGHSVICHFSSEKAGVKISQTAVSDYLEGRKITSTTAFIAPTNDMDGIESTKTPITTTHE